MDKKEYAGLNFTVQVIGAWNGFVIVEQPEHPNPDYFIASGPNAVIQHFKKLFDLRISDSVEVLPPIEAKPE